VRRVARIMGIRVVGGGIEMQVPLTDNEVRMLPVGNQNTDDMSMIEYEMLKGRAAEVGVNNWLSVIDTSLMYEENMWLIEKNGVCGERKPTMRELAHLWDFR